MIAGTIVVEGMCVQFSMIGTRVEYTVQDGVTGTSATRSVTPGEWAATLALMIGGDAPELAGMEHGLYDIAELAQPDAASLNYVEGVETEALLIAVRSVRMIP